ncbi:ATP-binding protein [Candidatus Binatia bacterium]|nr:ATP-binding protein [Candidatus Binatia bacterium]
MDRALAPFLRRDAERKIVLISGPRQSGKTTLARGLFPQFEYFNYDAPEDRVILRRKEWPRDTPVVIFDELHKMKGWKSWIKGIFDREGIPPRLVVTGSARLDLARRVGDSLAGRHFLFRLHPFSLKELRGALPREESFQRLLHLGGFPEPFLENDPTFYQRWRRAHSDIILRQDLLDLEQVRHIQGLETLVELLRSRVGSTVSYRSLARDLERDATTVKRWLTLLENLYLVFRVTPWHRNVARSLLKEPKFYFYDNGQVHGDDGARLENLVACALLREIEWMEDIGGRKATLHFLRTKDGREIDFLVVIDGWPALMVEAKWKEDAPSPHFASFSRFLGSRPQQVQVVATLTRRKQTASGVRIEPAAQWLESLELPLSESPA